MDTAAATETKLKQASKPGPYLAAGVLTIGLLAGSIGVWAVMANLDSAVIAPGEIKAESNVKTVAHLEGGIIQDILVRDGDRVEEGAPLLRLDRTIDKANFTIVDDQMLELEAKRIRLLAEHEGAIIPDFERVARDGRDSARYQDVINRQNDLFVVRERALRNDTALFSQRQQRFREEVDGLERQKASSLNQIELIRDELRGLQMLESRGLTTRSRVLALEREAERLQGAVASIDTSIARAQNGIEEIEIEKSGRMRAFLQEVNTELEKIGPRLAALREQRVAAQRRLELVEIRAPVAGTIVGLTTHTEGGVVQPGETILNIVPEGDRLIVEVRVSPIHIDRILVGQEARVRLSSFNPTTTPEAAAEIVSISADSFSDERTGQSYYTATLRLNDDQPEGVPIDDLLPGMLAEAFILMGERTAIAYLIQPLESRIARSFTEE